MTDGISNSRRVLQCGLVLGLLVLAWQAVSFGLGLTLRRASPALAAQFAPGNALVLGRLAQDQLKSRSPVALETARRALRRDPTSAAAAGALSMMYARQGDARRSAAVLDYSEMLSRRDLPTQLWAIEMAVQRNDIPGALRHYDVALRVGKAMPTLLFPVLTSAAADPAIRAPLARMLARGTPWKDSFLDYMTARSNDIRPPTHLLSTIYALGGKVGDGPASIVIQRLAEAGDISAAWLLYQRANPGISRAGLRNGGFNLSPALPTVFDWRVEDSGDARAEILRVGRDGELHFEARVGAGSTVASQRLLLPAGRYRLGFSVRAADRGALGASRIEVTCIPSGLRLAEVRLDGAVNGRGSVPLAVGPACPSQSIVLVAQSATMDSGVDAALDDVSIRPESPSGLLH